MREGQSNSFTDFGTILTSLFPHFTSDSEQTLQTSAGTVSSVREEPFGGVEPVVVGVSVYCVRDS